MRCSRWLLRVAVLWLALLTVGCAGRFSVPIEISVVDGERAQSYRGTEVVQYYRWWADVDVRNKTGQPLYVTLDRISYGRDKDVVPAGVAEAAGKTYARPDWKADGAGTYGRPDERITIGPGEMLELRDLGFESHPEGNKGTIRIAVEGMGTTESPEVDFMSFKSRPGK